MGVTATRYSIIGKAGVSVPEHHGLATGKKITDKYRIEEVEGKMFDFIGKAKHLTLGSFCVIKTPRTKFRQDSRY